jgi:hydroxyacylglutathione hydrolase
MILKRFYDERLAQASYLVGCSATRQALIVDPNRAIAQYVDAARHEGLQITHVTETHIHADFVSGARELAAATGAVTCLSKEGGPDWQYEAAGQPGISLIGDGDSFMIGNIRIDVVHTPGHTPEHLSFLVTDTAAADRPLGAFTGDFIFAGDVGRPDLLEKAAGMTGTTESSARSLFASLQMFKRYPDYLQLWPGHGAGSACGKSLGAMPQTTLGYERLFNWALAAADEASFVATVVEGQPDSPHYFAEMKRINRAGPPLLADRPSVRPLAPAALLSVLEQGGLVVDVRPWKDFAARHAAGTVNIPLNGSFTKWAGWIVPYTADFQVLAADAVTAAVAIQALSMIGLDRVSGTFDEAALAEAERAGRVAVSTETDMQSMRAAISRADTVVLDVRNTDEWEAAHMPEDAGAVVLHIPLGQLDRRAAEVPRDARVLVHCKGGSRSAIATSILERHGVRTAENVRGGFDAWIAQQ